MDRGAWQATIYRVTRVGHDLVPSFFLICMVYMYTYYTYICVYMYTYYTYLYVCIIMYIFFHVKYINSFKL